jgi:GTP-binding protein HflX
LSDTVGFIRDLPHKLVVAFRATLQEAADADLLLHIVDAASPVLDEQMLEVERVLDDIGAASIPQIIVYNKQDMLDEDQRPREPLDWVERPGDGAGAGVRAARVFVSALDGSGLDLLREQIAQALQASLAESAAALNFPQPPPDSAVEFDSEDISAEADPDSAATHPTQA